MSAWPANSRTSCIVAPLRMASLIAVLRKRVDADAAAAQPVGVDPGRPAVLLHQPPGGLAVQVPPHEAARRPGVIGRNSGPSLSSPMPARAT